MVHYTIIQESRREAVRAVRDTFGRAAARAVRAGHVVWVSDDEGTHELVLVGAVLVVRTES